MPIVDPKLLEKVHFGKSECPECHQEAMVFVGIMRAVDVLPDSSCEVYQCLNCEYNMIFALIEDEEGEEMIRGEIVQLDAEPPKYFCPSCNSWALECTDERPFTEPPRNLHCTNCGQSYVVGVFDEDETE